MKPVWLILFGFTCVLQLVLVLNKGISLLSEFLEDKVLFLLKAIALGLVALLPIFAGTIMSNHLPDKVIAGKKKRKFNIFKVVSFLMIPFLLFGIFKEYEQLPGLSEMMEMHFITQQVFSLGDLLLSGAILVLHLIILFGLYQLNASIELNAGKKSAAN
jgi:uncharacterized membrane protein